LLDIQVDATYSMDIAVTFREAVYFDEAHVVTLL
jgi:hypothetical protein